MQKIRRQSAVVNFQEAKSIGILYAAGTDEEQDLLKKYAQYLKEERKTYYFLGYVDRKRVPEHLKEAIGNTYFSKADLNWHMKPVGGSVRNFLSQNFDVLIDLSVREYIPLLYICALSKAKFRIGRMGSEWNGLYDMMISVEPETEMKNLFKQIDHYLNIIQSK